MAIEKIFVIEDSAVQCEHAMALCSTVAPDAQIRSAKDGIDALVELRKVKTSVALVDLEMPLMDGVELIRHIAAENLAQSVVILSSKDPALIASVGVMAQAAGLVVLGTLQKPLTLDSLSRALSEYQTVLDNCQPQPLELPTLTDQDLHQAMKENQFSLHYQPKVTADKILLKGVEALARWSHPIHGNISPVHFIQLAESAECIDELTTHLFALALQQKKAWADRGLSVHIAFNLSPMSLHNVELVDWACKLATRYGVAFSDITFEVTENILLKEVALSIETLARLRLKGFKIALDDYGTGFANAEQLARIPATELKIDRSMIEGVNNKPQLEKILESTVSLGNELNLTVVAEGVETLEEFHIIRSLGVSQVQGYFFAKPLPPSELVNWASKRLSNIRQSLQHH